MPVTSWKNNLKSQLGLESLQIASEMLKCLKKNNGKLDASHQDSVGVILADTICV
jgi:hypothetical protein